MTRLNRLRLVEIIGMGLVLVAVIWLAFKDLGDVYLWEDEAETANLAWNTLRFGWPTPWDGTNFISQLSGPGVIKIGSYFFWTFHPWLHFYLIAPFFLILGKSVLAVRIPSVLFGILAVVFFHQILKRFSGLDLIARFFTTVVFAFNPAFLVLIRQARYYSFSILLVLVATYFFLDWIKSQSRHSFWKLVLGLVLLFHTNFQAFLAVGFVMIGFVFFSWRRFFRSENLGMFLNATILGLIAVVPFAVLASMNRPELVTLEPARWLKLLTSHARQVTNYLAPLTMFVLTPVLWFKIKDKQGKSLWVYSVALTIFGLLIAILTEPGPYFRYISFLFPMLLVLILIPVFRYSTPLGFLITLMLLLMQLGPEGYLSQFWYEIHHEYRGPQEGLVEYFSGRVDPASLVYIDCNADPVIFGTPVTVVNQLKNEYAQKWGIEQVPLKKIDYVVDRHDCPSRYSETELRKYFNPITINYPDLGHQNREELALRSFKSATESPPVRIWINKGLED